VLCGLETNPSGRSKALEALKTTSCSHLKHLPCLFTLHSRYFNVVPNYGRRVNGKKKTRKGTRYQSGRSTRHDSILQEHKVTSDAWQRHNWCKELLKVAPNARLRQRAAVKARNRLNRAQSILAQVSRGTL
jgi:hypothetical protein